MGCVGCCRVLAVDPACVAGREVLAVDPACVAGRVVLAVDPACVGGRGVLPVVPAWVEPLDAGPDACLYRMDGGDITRNNKSYRGEELSKIFCIFSSWKNNFMFEI